MLLERHEPRRRLVAIATGGLATLGFLLLHARLESSGSAIGAGDWAVTAAPNEARDQDISADPVRGIDFHDEMSDKMPRSGGRFDVPLGGTRAGWDRGRVRMIRKMALAAALLVAIPLSLGQSHAASCTQWNAANPAQHHTTAGGAVDIVGGQGYGSGNHDAAHASPPNALGAYGDPQRRAAEGGYVQVVSGNVVVSVNAFGPIDENDSGHVYDTAAGACVSSGNTGVDTGEKCVKTSLADPPTAWGTWTPCGGY